MNPSHDRHTEPGFPHPRKPAVVAKAQGKEFSVLRMAPQYPAGPERVVCAGNDAVAQFFCEADALAYAQWRNDNARRSPQSQPSDRVHQSP